MEKPKSKLCKNGLHEITGEIFDGGYKCLECKRASASKGQSKYRQDPIIKEQLLHATREWRTLNPEHLREYNKQRYIKNYQNPEFVAHKSEYDKERWRSLEMQTHYAENREKISLTQTLRNIGMTEDLYYQLLEKQKGLCAICGMPETRRSRSGVLCRLSVDHDHTTDKVRALLCHQCNVGIGNFDDNEELLIKAANYVKQHNGVNNA